MQTDMCKKCGGPKNYTIKSGKRAGKLHTYCRKCLSAQVNDWTQRNPERARENQRRYWKNNPDKKLRAGMKRYGVDEVWYNAKLEEQNSLCAICKRGEDRRSGKARLSVDHHHDSGALRGLLCNTCNMRLAGLESQEWFRNAEAYLQKYNP